MNARKISPFMIIAVLFLSSCARTHVTSVWKKSDFVGPPIQSVIIFAQTGNTYSRFAWENMIAERFQRSRMQAVPAASEFSGKNSVSIDRVIAYARDQGIDGVLVIRHVDTRTVKTYHPPETEIYYTERYYYPDRRGYYPHSEPRYRRNRHGHWYAPFYSPYFYYEHDVVVTPGYTSYHRIVLVECYLYQAEQREQVWSMSTETYDPRSDAHLVADISRNAFRSLRRYGLILLTR